MRQGRRGHPGDHSDRDRISTPVEVAKHLIQKIPYEQGDTWFDPCRGGGAFYDQFPSTGAKGYCEIDEGYDYLSTVCEGWDWVVTNIPFSQPAAFIDKMSDDCVKGFGILCLANSMTGLRLAALEHKGLYVVNMTTVYIRQGSEPGWGFGYRTDFYVFTRTRTDAFEVLIHDGSARRSTQRGY